MHPTCLSSIAMDFVFLQIKWKTSNIKQLSILLLSHLRRVSETYSNLKTKYQGPESFITEKNILLWHKHCTFYIRLVKANFLKVEIKADAQVALIRGDCFQPKQSEFVKMHPNICWVLTSDHTSLSVFIKFGNQIKNRLNGQHIVMMQRLHYLHPPIQKGLTEIVMNWTTPST